MGKKLTSVLGIDIGSSKIKLAELRSQGNEPVITAIGMIDTPSGAADHTGVYDSDAVGAAIKQLIAETGASVPTAVVSIAGQQSVLVRTLEVPRMNPQELTEHMQWEVTRNVPFAESEIVSDFRPLEDVDPASQNIDVVLAISPQSAVNTLINCVKKAGKQISAIDVEPLGIARALRVHPNGISPSDAVCMVDIGSTTTSINIYRNANLLMPRQVPIGGEMFTRAVADALGVTQEEAERVKIEKGEVPESAAASTAPGATQGFTPYNPFAEDPMNFNPALAPAGESAEAASAAPEPVAAPSGDAESMQVYNAMAPVIDEFVGEVRRSIDYFRGKGGDVNKVLLCGGGAKLRGLAPFLGAVLGVGCEVYDPLAGMPMNAKRLAPGLIEHDRTDFTVAVGNGLHIFFD